MLEYMHFVPGRFRLKLSELRNQFSASEAEAYIAAIPGVTGVAVNPATGSLTINFRKELSIDDLRQSLRSKGYCSNRFAEPGAVGQECNDSAGAESIRRAVTAVLLDAVVRHSAQALVRALL
jgi:copper chaperone CopZ